MRNQPPSDRSARHDEEASRAKERIVSVRSASDGWEPRAQRPEPWRAFNWRLSPGQTIRAFPLSSWAEQDLWLYILARRIEFAPLYRATERPVVIRDGLRIVVDDPARMRSRLGEEAARESVRFRTLGCSARDRRRTLGRPPPSPTWWPRPAPPNPPSAAAASATRLA